MPTQEVELDVRREPPARRHELIFKTYEGLEPGAAFVLVNDHDPKPLYYQFAAEQPDRFSWDYLEQGPDVWRVRIGRSRLMADGPYPRASAELAQRRNQLAPETHAAFDAFSARCSPTAPAGKTKQLIAVAVAHVTQCPYCIRRPHQGALDATARATRRSWRRSGSPRRCAPAAPTRIRLSPSTPCIRSRPATHRPTGASSWSAHTVNHGRTSTDLARAATLPPAAALAGLRCGCGSPDGRPGRPAAAREGPQPLGLKALPAGFLRCWWR